MACAVMLQELTYHIQLKSQTWLHSDHMGSVGAALCWQHRENAASTCPSHANRLEQTSTAQWDRELSKLRKHGFQIFGYHKESRRAIDSADRAKSAPAFCL